MQQSIAQYNYGIGIMDFYLPEGNMALFVDGGLWHADPRLYVPEDILFFKFKTSRKERKNVTAKDVWKKDGLQNSYHNYTRQYYSPPGDRLVISTLSITSPTVDGILIWHKIDSPVIQEYLKNIDNNKAYITKMDRMKELQIEDELAVGATTNRIHFNSTETEKNCLEWYKKYLRAYDYWLSLDSVQKEDDSLKEMLLSFID